MMEQSELIKRLSMLLATIRRRLVAYGLCAVFAGGVAGFLTIVALDWLLHLPPLIRVGAAGVFLAGFAAAATHWVVKPLCMRLGIAEVASRLELHFKPLQDRLTSSVDFLERGDAGSPSMMRHVVAGTEKMIRDIPLESALTLRPLILRGVLLTASAVLLTIVLLVSRGWASTGLYRYVHPWGGIEWPRKVSLLPLTGDQTVAVGESVLVRMRVQRGLHPSLRGIVRLREPDGVVQALAMQRDADESFYASIDTVTENLTYWFEAGDDTTARSPYTIRAVRRPEVVEALVAVEPPSYASSRSVRVQDLSDGPVRAPIGGSVRVTLQANKPIPPDASGTRLGLRTDAGELIPLRVNPEDHDELSARFDVSGDVRFRIELVDENGFENRGAGVHSILAMPDAPPTVVVVEPKAATELTPTGSIPLLIRVEDDFGVRSLDLEFEHVGGASRTVSLTDNLETSGEGAAVEATAHYLWKIEPLALSPGDALVYTAVATDNRITRDGKGQTARSAPMRVKIISELEFDIHVRSDLALLEARIRQAALDQADLLDRTATLVRPEPEPAALTDAEREITATLARRQARLVGGVRNLGNRFYRLTERMRRNKAGDEETRHRISLLGDSLRQTAAGPMTAASTQLSDAREQMETSAQQTRLLEAVRQERRAVDRLRSLLRTMSQWGSFHELVTKARDLLDRQLTLRMQTAELGKTMLGKPVGSLTEAERAALRHAGRRQEQLAEDVEQYLAKMKQLVKTMTDKDPHGADAVTGALRASRAHNLTKHARSASKAIQANRTAAATIEQKATADAMRKTIAALLERERRKLEQLRKRIEQAQQQVASLISEQRALREATREASLIDTDDATYGLFEQEQRTLKLNAKSLGEELAAVERTSPAGRLVRKAATPMGQAEAKLRERQPREATDAQDEALALLEEALARLKEIAQETAEEALRRSLAQIREDLQEILSAQSEVNGGLGGLVEAIAKRGRIRRLEARMASKLARQQAEVRAMVDAQLPDFEKVAVYKWALERVATWMETSRTRLSRRQIDDDLVALASRIVRELKKLIDAIVETESLPVDTDFVESEAGGGGGQGQGMSGKPVPTVAELLVLKAMQADINQRTRELPQTIGAENVTEGQLRALKTIGEDQSEVRRLTERVTQNARHP